MNWIDRIPQSHSLLKSYLMDNPNEVRHFAYSTLIGLVDMHHDPKLVMLALDRLQGSSRASTPLVNKLENLIAFYSDQCNHWGFQSNKLDQLIECLISVIISAKHPNTYKRIEQLLDNDYPITVQSNLYVGLAGWFDRFNVAQFFDWIRGDSHPYKVYTLATLWDMGILEKHRSFVFEVAQQYVVSKCYYSKLSAARILSTHAETRKSLKYDMEIYNDALLYSDRKLVREVKSLLITRKYARQQYSKNG